MQETQETQVQSLGQEDPQEKKMATTPCSCQELHGQRRPGGLQRMGCKELDMTLKLKSKMLNFYLSHF